MRLTQFNQHGGVRKQAYPRLPDEGGDSLVSLASWFPSLLPSLWGWSSVPGQGNKVKHTTELACQRVSAQPRRGAPRLGMRQARTQGLGPCAAVLVPGQMSLRATKDKEMTGD